MVGAINSLWVWGDDDEWSTNPNPTGADVAGRAYVRLSRAVPVATLNPGGVAQTWTNLKARLRELGIKYVLRQ